MSKIIMTKISSIISFTYNYSKFKLNQSVEWIPIEMFRDHWMILLHSKTSSHATLYETFAYFCTCLTSIGVHYISAVFHNCLGDFHFGWISISIHIDHCNETITIEFVVFQLNSVNIGIRFGISYWSIQVKISIQMQLFGEERGGSSRQVDKMLHTGTDLPPFQILCFHNKMCIWTDVWRRGEVVEKKKIRTTSFFGETFSICS